MIVKVIVVIFLLFIISELFATFYIPLTIHTGIKKLWTRKRGGKVAQIVYGFCVFCMFKPYEIKIPVRTATEAIKANEIGMVSVLFFLKCLYGGGTIHKYKLRAKELSKACGYTKKTYNKYILQLMNKGLVREKNGMLVLASNKIICKYYLFICIFLLLDISN